MLAFVWACASGMPPQVPRDTQQLAAIEASVDLDGKPVGKSDARATIVVVFASWCTNCHHELGVIAKLRQANVRVLGVNYKGHEEYDGRGNPTALRTYVAEHAPWLRVVPADDQLYALLGQPPKIPTVYVYDANGALVATYDRRDRAMPEQNELADLLRRLGA